MAKPTGLIADSPFSARDFREAKREWSERLLASAQAAPQAIASARRTGAHAMAAAARPVPARRNTNVVGVGVAEKLVAGKPTGVMCVKFFVRTKFPSGTVPRGLALPKNIDGLPVDVEEAGTFRAQARARKRKRGRAADDTMPNPRVRLRPAPAGCSVGFRVPGDQFVMTGTFGCVVKTTRRVFILSNNHVLADENRMPVGSPIFQPALMDGGSVAADQIAELTRFIRLRTNRFNRIDAAIAEPLSPNLIDKTLLHIGAPNGTAPAAVDMMVHKFGRTTSYTAGRIISIDTDVIVEYETADFTFDNQIIIRGSNNSTFSASGDSGSAILQRGTNAVVGLLFGGGPNHTIANHIANVLRSLRVKIA